MQKPLKIIRTVILIFFALILLVMIIIQTRPIKNLLRNIVIKKANEMLYKAELSLERIDGNYFTSLTLKGIRIKQNDQDILTVKEISLHYSLSNLLQKKILIRRVLIDDLDLILEQDAENKWNLLTIFPQAKDSPEGKGAKKPNKWKIELQDCTLQNSDFIINAQDTESLVPARISDLLLQFKASYTEQEGYIQLDQCNFRSYDPDFEIENIKFIARLQNNLAYLDTLEIKTPQNLFCSSAQLDIESKQIAFIILNINPLKLAEFQAFIPENDIKIMPEIDIRFKLIYQTARLDLKIEQNEQMLDLSATVDSVFSVPDYDVNLEIAHLDGDSWLADEKLDSDINLLLQVKGKGIDPQKAEGNLDLVILFSRLEKRTLDLLEVKANKSENSADFSALGNGNFGRITIDGKLRDIFEKLNYQLNGSLEKLNIAPLLENDSLYSDINLSFHVKGKGTALETLIADVELESGPSTFRDIELDKVVADIHYDREKYIIRNMELNNTLANLKLSGKGNISGNHDLDFNLQFGNLEPLKELIIADELSLAGNITGKVNAQGDDINANMDLQLSQLKYNNFSSEKLEGTLEARKQKNDLNADISLYLTDLSNGELTINSLNLHSSGNGKRFKNVLDVLADSLKIHCEADVLPDSIITIELLDLGAEYGLLLVETENPDARIMISKDAYQIEQLYLKVNDGLIKIEGILAPEGNQDISVVIEDMELDQLNRLGLITQAVQGRLDFSTKLTGKLKQPVLKASVNVQNAGWENILLGNVDIAANLADNQLISTFSLNRDSLEVISGSVKIPVYLDTLLSREMIPTEEQLEADIFFKDMDIGVLKPSFTQIKQLEGKFNVDLQVRNTVADPIVSGNITLAQGKIKIPEWGINYHNVHLNSTISNDIFTLEELYLKGGSGTLQISGTAELEKPLSKGVKTIDLRVLAKQFTAAEKRGLFLLLNSDIRLAGRFDQLKYSGYLNIPRAVIDLDRLPGSNTNKVDLNSPLLVQAAKKNDPAVSGSVVKKKEIQPDMIKNLTGELKLDISKNTWIRSKEMNVEIAGELRIIKEGKDFEIFGNVKTLRGKYEIYGRKFNIQEGMITFNGEAKPDPFFDLAAQYMFRDIDREKRLLKLKVTGKALRPIVEFYLDDELISETDAISYLLFGRSSDEISSGQKSEVDAQTESDMALSFISTQIGNKIADQIGDKLHLDVIEFSGGENWKAASILAGKYITNDLFIKYKKEFSLGQSKEIVPDEVSLEYEFNKHFSLQATRGDEKTTGIDFFWKFDEK